MMRALTPPVVLASLLCACCPVPPAPDITAVQPTATAETRVFENPGGMWTPAQLAQHVETLEDLGLEIPAAALTDPTSFPLGAVIWLGGCSASFVSPEGLIITNHHCATGALQFNSTPEHNLLRDGYLAQTRKDEKSNGPTARVFVTQKFTDVTSTVRAGVATESQDKARHDLIEQRQKQLVADCEKGRSHLRCSVVSYFGGATYTLIEQLEIRDVRVVYAPAAGIGSFGGEIDNWRWPRHSGDYAFFRAYVGPDGAPADYHVDNVPYRPKHHLKVASTPLSKGDLVFVAGYPGRTTRLRTSREVGEAVDWYYPRVLQLCDDYIALLEKLAKQSDELDIKGQRLHRGLSNWRTNTKGMLDGLVKGGLKDQKAKLEADLKEWIASRPEHAAADQAIDNLAANYAKYRSQRDQDAAHREAAWMSSLLGAADVIVRMAEERPKADADRHPDYQQRNWKRIQQRQQHVQRNYHRTLDEAKLNLALARAARLAGDERPELLRLVVGDGKPSPAAIGKAVARLYDETELADAAKRIALIEEATTAELKKSNDPFIQLALKLRPILQAAEDRADAYEGSVIIERPKFIDALRASRGGVLAPDANSTLRITYGTVRGYSSQPEAPVYFPFTKLSEMVDKHTGVEPFNAPANLVEAAKKGPYGPYVHEEVGEVPVDFLSDLDITGGNSGSPTLNARGELVGLAFDGNYEAMASDWIFMPAITRSIHVDIRYVLWIMDRVDGADHLLTEMGLTPALP